MAIFARRRLQAMLDGLAPLLDEAQALDLVRRLESKEIEQALPAEMELGLIWGIAQLGHVEIEPPWYSTGKRLPDLLSDALVADRETIVEITALSDAVLPADRGMRNASRKLSQEAGRIRKGAGRYLSYYFFEETAWTGKGSLRRVRVPRDLMVSDTLRDQLRAWVGNRDRQDGDKLHLAEGELKVAVTWHAVPQGRYNFATSMPPEIRDISDNYIYRALDTKAKQVRNAHFTGVRCVILADVGSTALRQFDRTDPTARVYNGAQTATHFLRDKADPGIDIVAIVTPRRQMAILGMRSETIHWKIGLYCRPGTAIDLSGFERLATLLPKPRREGYQSRLLHEQAIFAPMAKGRYVATIINWWKGEKTEVKISARAFLDLLAGRITPDQAKRAFDTAGAASIKAHLDRGETISDLRLEPGGPDSDDDHIVLTFTDDPAARPFKVPDDVKEGS
ncbi:hypothetical protein QH494_24895 [Sphingomonas sp. AR_OL41]|uniref:hypothetical protein n=1 Tax=Sphingomonas sp. AR_OL41 TaxID=3042729 RepID=UPI0024819438|nr:hypothetical protein [Sphingomonas sp. AR_OL41]MDH7975438.1 hypothetical protein [Sphingomonas sp. AR_OL41]